MLKDQKEPFPDHIIWLHTAFLGDLIILSSAIRLMREKSPKTKQHLITTAVGYELFSGEGELDFVHVFNKSKGSTLRAFKETKKSVIGSLNGSPSVVVIQPHKSLRSSLLSLYLGFPVFTYLETTGSFFAKKRIPRVACFHERQRLNLFLELFGVSREECLTSPMFLRKRTQFQSGHFDKTWINIRSHCPYLIAMAPGSRWGTKRWPLDKFKELVSRLVKSGHSIVVVGSEVEAAYGVELASIAPNQVFNLCGETSLQDLRALYPQVDLVVTNDSSPIHFASAFNIPTVGIFGATVPEFGFGPQADQHEVAEVNWLDCRPCSDHGPDRCPKSHFKCMKELTVDLVFESILRLKAEKK